MFLVIDYLRYITIKWHVVTTLKHVSLLKISYSCVNPMTLSSSYAIAMTDKVAHFHYSQMCIKTMTLKRWRVVVNAVSFAQLTKNTSCPSDPDIGITSNKNNRPVLVLRRNAFRQFGMFDFAGMAGVRFEFDCPYLLECSGSPVSGYTYMLLHFDCNLFQIVPLVMKYRLPECQIIGNMIHV